MRGGERALLAFCELFPDADLYTLVQVPGAGLPALAKAAAELGAVDAVFYDGGKAAAFATGPPGHPLRLYSPPHAAEDVNQKILDLRKQVEELEKKSEEYRNAVNSKQKEAQSLKREIDILNNQIYKLETQIKITGNKITVARLSITDLRDKIFDRQEAISEKKEVIASLINLFYKKTRKISLTLW